MENILLIGTISKQWNKNYFKGEVQHEGNILVKRSSGTVDQIPIVVDGYPLTAGENVLIKGEVRTYNYKDKEGKSHKKIFVKVLEHCVVDDKYDYNNAELSGTIVSVFPVRQTPQGKEICDFLLAVNYEDGKSAYINAIAWGRAAHRIAEEYKTGDKIYIKGRFQSREYNKVIPCRYKGNVRVEKEKTETRIAYEVSVMRFGRVYE